MNLSFGINYEPSSLLWDDIRKGPSLEAVREHLDRVVNFGRNVRDGQWPQECSAAVTPQQRMGGCTCL